jgi:hypothetical protein
VTEAKAKAWCLLIHAEASLSGRRATRAPVSERRARVPGSAGIAATSPPGSPPHHPVSPWPTTLIHQDTFSTFRQPLARTRAGVDCVTRTLRSGVTAAQCGDHRCDALFHDCSLQQYGGQGGHLVPPHTR